MLSSQKTYSIVKQVISDVTGRERKRIRADMKLTDDLGFTPQGKGGLSSRLNTAFAEHELTSSPRQTRACGTVRDLWRLYWDMAKEKEITS